MQPKYRLILPDQQPQPTQPNCPGSILDQLAWILDPPALIEDYTVEQAEYIHRLYPTQPWTKVTCHRRPQQLFPRTMFEYHSGPFETDDLIQARLAHRVYRDRINQMNLVIDALEGRIAPYQVVPKVYQPWAASLLLHGWRSNLSRHNQDRLIERAVTSPAGAYALSTAVPLRPEQWQAVVERLLKSPRHLYRWLHDLPSLAPQPPAREMALKAAESSPLYYALLARHFDGPTAEEQILVYLSPLAKQMPQAAALLCVLQPQSSTVATWVELVGSDPWWSYELGYLLISLLPDTFARWKTSLQASAMRDPMTAYHWMRDINPEDSALFTELYPSPFVLDWAEEQQWSLKTLQSHLDACEQLKAPQPQVQAAIERYLLAQQTQELPR